MSEKLLVLQLGSNLGKRTGNLKQACLLIEESIGQINTVSSIYETEAWGYDSEHGFLNQCLTLPSNLDPWKILRRIQLIEEKLGREERSLDYIDRLIDIDILFFGDMVVWSSDLKIPHSKIQDRRFTLVPLAEILPDFQHPVLRKSISTLLSECRDNGVVRRIEIN